MFWKKLEHVSSWIQNVLPHFLFALICIFIFFEKKNEVCAIIKIILVSVN